MKDLCEQNEWVRGVTTPTPPTLLLTDSWCLKSLFYPIWWQLPCLLTHPPILHFVLPIAPAANLINVNSNRLHSSLVTLLPPDSNPPTSPAVCSPSSQLANSTWCQNVEVNWLSLSAVIAPMQVSFSTYTHTAFLQLASILSGCGGRASPDESPPRRRPPAFTLLLAAAIVSAVMMLLTSVTMTVWGHVETPLSWLLCF